MELLIGALCVGLLLTFFVQIGKARELASIVRNDEREEEEMNNVQAGIGMLFMVVFLVACVVSFIYYAPYTLGWGPNTAASEHGGDIDYMFNLSLFFTSIVFFLTHIALFLFAWQYRGKRNRKAKYWAHNEKLEMVWMIIPAVVMTFLVVGGLQSWNEIMGDVGLKEDGTKEIAGEDYIEIEARGTQFEWLLRHPGRDGKLGKTNFLLIDDGKSNKLGQDWSDAKNIDDIIPDKIVLPRGEKVRVRITARDVLHNFYVRDMRVKMDAIPGLPTYFVFTPTVTTDSMRRRLSALKEWQVPDKNDETKERWETYEYELACAELCGKGHYSMRRIVRIVEPEEYEAWLDEAEGGAAGAKSNYMTNVRNLQSPDKRLYDDPFEGMELEHEKILVIKDSILKAYSKIEKTLDECDKALTTEKNKPAKDNDLIKALVNNIKSTKAIKEKFKPILTAARTNRTAKSLTDGENNPLDQAYRLADQVRTAAEVLGTGPVLIPETTTDSTATGVDSTAVENINN